MRRREQPYLLEKVQSIVTNCGEEFESEGYSSSEANIAKKIKKMKNKVVSVAECEALFRFTKVDKL